MKTVFFTGAGISANAGIPVYRSAGSSWTDGDLEEKSHAARYGNHLSELWDKHWGPLHKIIGLASPTYTHKRIAEFGGTVITQNIDDLHERAGSTDVMHLHGAMSIKCIRCRREADTYGWAGHGAPVCVRCGKNKTRPDVVLFGENLNKKLFRQATESLLDATHLVVIGSSLNVHPAAGLVMDALSSSIHTIVINKDKPKFWQFFKETHFADSDEVIDDVLASIRG